MQVKYFLQVQWVSFCWNPSTMLFWSWTEICSGFLFGNRLGVRITFQQEFYYNQLSGHGSKLELFTSKSLGCFYILLHAGVYYYFYNLSFFLPYIVSQSSPLSKPCCIHVPLKIFHAAHLKKHLVFSRFKHFLLQRVAPNMVLH